MLRNVTVEVEQGDPDVYEVTRTVALPELKCGETGPLTSCWRWRKGAPRSLPCFPASSSSRSDVLVVVVDLLLTEAIALLLLLLPLFAFAVVVGADAAVIVFC